MSRFPIHRSRTGRGDGPNPLFASRSSVSDGLGGWGHLESVSSVFFKQRVDVCDPLLNVVGASGGLRVAAAPPLARAWPRPMTKLKDTQLIVLSSAAKHDDGLATRPASLNTAAAMKVASSLAD